MHFVNDVDLGARRNRAIARILDDLAHVVDAGMGSRVHLDDVNMARLHDRLTVDAEFGHVDARLVDLAGQGIVERAGENAGSRRLADAAHAGQDIGLMDATRGEGIGERAHHRLLADEVLEANRPVFSRQHPIGDGQRSGGRIGDGEERIAQWPPLSPIRSRCRSISSFARRSPCARSELNSGQRPRLRRTASAHEWEVGQRPALSR